VGVPGEHEVDELGGRQEPPGARVFQRRWRMIHRAWQVEGLVEVRAAELRDELRFLTGAPVLPAERGPDGFPEASTARSVGPLALTTTPSAGPVRAGRAATSPGRVPTATRRGRPRSPAVRRRAGPVPAPGRSRAPVRRRPPPRPSGAWCRCRRRDHPGTITHRGRRAKPALRCAR